MAEPHTPPHNPPHPHSNPPEDGWTERIKVSSQRLPSDAEEFLDYLDVQKNHPKTTVRGYRTDLSKFTAFRLAYAPRAFERLTENLRPEEWRDLLREYRKALAEVLPHPRSRARALIAIRRFLIWANREGLLAEDFSWCVEIPKFTLADPHPIATAGVPALLEALPRDDLAALRDRALIYFLLTTGCRITEALSVDRSALRAEGTRVLGKGGKYRTVYLTQGAWDAVAEYLDERGVDDAPALFIGFSPRDYHSAEQREKRVLPHNRLTANGARVVVQRLRKSLATTPELAKILADFRSPHVARHTAATTLLESSGGDVRLVQEVLGHASLQTLQVYTEITDKRKAAAYKRFGTFLGEKDPGPSPKTEARTREGG